MQVLEDDDRGRVADQVGQDGQAGVQPLDRAARRVGEGRQLLLVDPGRPSMASSSTSYGRDSEPGSAWPTSTTAVPSGTVASSSCTSRVLPMPGSPAMSATAGLARRRELRQPAQLAVPPDHHRAGAAARGSHGARVPVGCRGPPASGLGGRCRGPPGGGEQALLVGLGDQLALAVVELGQLQFRVEIHFLAPFRCLGDDSILGR